MCRGTDSIKLCLHIVWVIGSLECEHREREREKEREREREIGTDRQTDR